MAERMLLEKLELTRTEWIGVSNKVLESLAALHTEADRQHSHSLRAWQEGQLQCMESVRLKEEIIQALTADQAQCAALAEQWRAKFEMQVGPNALPHLCSNTAG